MGPLSQRPQDIPEPSSGIQKIFVDRRAALNEIKNLKLEGKTPEQIKADLTSRLQEAKQVAAQKIGDAPKNKVRVLQFQLAALAVSTRRDKIVTIFKAIGTELGGQLQKGAALVSKARSAKLDLEETSSPSERPLPKLDLKDQKHFPKLHELKGKGGAVTQEEIANAIAKDLNKLSEKQGGRVSLRQVQDFAQRLADVGVVGDVIANAVMVKDGIYNPEKLVEHLLAGNVARQEVKDALGQDVVNMKRVQGDMERLKMGKQFGDRAQGAHVDIARKSVSEIQGEILGQISNPQEIGKERLHAEIDRHKEHLPSDVQDRLLKGDLLPDELMDMNNKVEAERLSFKDQDPQKYDQMGKQASTYREIAKNMNDYKNFQTQVGQLSQEDRAKLEKSPVDSKEIFALASRCNSPLKEKLLLMAEISGPRGEDFVKAYADRKNPQNLYKGAIEILKETKGQKTAECMHNLEQLFQAWRKNEINPEQLIPQLGLEPDIQENVLKAWTLWSKSQ